MKKTFAALTVFAMLAASAAVVSAETVNLGLIEMDKAEYARLQGLVSGELSVASRTTAAAPAKVNAGLIEINAADLAAIRDYVDGRTAFAPSTGDVAAESKDEINGLVGMADSDLQEVRQLVEQKYNQNGDLFAGVSGALNR